MGWKPQHYVLAGMMIIFGTFNTLSVKWADRMTSESSDGTVQPFNHPFLQACGMFLGEMMCMVAFWVSKYMAKRRPQPAFPPIDDSMAPRSFNPLIFLPPALCDMTATSIQYIGLTLTYASSFQMFRGAVIIFTGIFSQIFLGRKMQWFKWMGIFLVISGLITVGINDVISQGGSKNTTEPTDQLLNQDLDDGRYWTPPPSLLRLYGAEGNGTKSDSDIILGDALIFCSQIIVATQMVLEEKFISKYNVPALQAVGWEGTFGFTTLSILLIPFSFIYVGPKFGNNPRHMLEDPYDGVYQLVHNPYLATAFCGTIISIAFFNFAGISVTKELSATTRMVLDSIRTISIWMFSISVGWQTFSALQLLGFAILLSGMCFYNDIIILPGIKKILRKCGVCVSEVPYDNVDEDEGEESNNQEPVFSPRASHPSQPTPFANGAGDEAQ